jgi:hypothetical protein
MQIRSIDVPDSRGEVRGHATEDQRTREAYPADASGYLTEISRRPHRKRLDDGIENDIKMRDGRIGLRRFWAPCALRHRPTNVDGIGRDSRCRCRKQMQIDLDRLALSRCRAVALSRCRNRSDASPASHAQRSQSTASRHIGGEHIAVSQHCLCGRASRARHNRLSIPPITTAIWKRIALHCFLRFSLPRPPSRHLYCLEGTFLSLAAFILPVQH